ncbi:manno-octulosonate cytidylyltransferase [Roseicyclus sp. F158]|uniref:Manno-octulosonate cytidylyltransferase n=1 Tax=Tropicimonas omnivorans TaxID=3075590 RepID=A0ABU3DCW6_9RHOB|nr:manno-octulosonate cytidylyltransferase [Roseicyclus sp. F158]MDT0681562.1 manno-octulosonate cytidylyltransferase [Roseicyclus sp. F158]
MSVLVVIPARYASERYPGKPLVPLRGASGRQATLVQRTWEAARGIDGVSRVVVATDDDRIREAAEGFGAEVVMTSSDCRNGTERCAEASDALGGGFEMVVNLQGDAPLTPRWFIPETIEGLRAAPDAGAATPVIRCDAETLNGLKMDRQAGRVGGTTAIFDRDHRALYFSKEVVPYTADAEKAAAVFHHVGLYAYRPEALTDYPRWDIGPLERTEGLEQLRFLENGRTMSCVEVETRGRQFWELNNPSDVTRLEEMMATMGME